MTEEAPGDAQVAPALDLGRGRALALAGLTFSAAFFISRLLGWFRRRGR